jgi:hypothetical protein
MGTRFDQPVVRRPSLPLTAEDEAFLAELRSEKVPRRALDSLLSVPLPPDASEAQLLHALLEVALNRVREARNDLGYAQLAVEYDGGKAKKAARRRPSALSTD